MPHIRTVFVDTPANRAYIRANKTTIRQIVADRLGYPAEDVAFIPEPIRPEDMDLADNVLPIEFVIDAGERWFGDEDAADEIRYHILEAPHTNPFIPFGVWVRGHRSKFAEHKP